MEVVSFDWSGKEFPFIGDEPQNEREVAYGKIKESRKEKVTHPAEYDEKGNITKDSWAEDVETNWFADSVDC